MKATAAFAKHVAERCYADLPPEAVRAAKTFILDTIGVGLAGSTGPKCQEIAAAQALFGASRDARVWSTGERLSAHGAALCNAYQAHNSEFDCVHEAAVAHVMTVVLPVALAGAERLGDVDGRRLIEAVVLGVDIAASLGVAARSGLRFFRPATVGAFGATAALGKLMGFDSSKMRHALSIAYGQLSGTMQAHTEGSMLLALQIGFSARNAVSACDLAALGVEGPENILEGPFGYFRLFELQGEPMHVVPDLGRIWRITEVAHKPFPSGRATHGIVDGCLELKAMHGFSAADIERITAYVPPLIHHLVGRPPKTEMAINYARLCASYVAACALFRGTIGIEDFRDEAYQNAETHALAKRMSIIVRDGGEPNALTPVEIEVALKSGAQHSVMINTVYGNPQKPMSHDAHLAKFRRNAASARVPVAPSKADRLISLVDDLEAVRDVRQLIDQIT